MIYLVQHDRIHLAKNTYFTFITQTYNMIYFIYQRKAYNIRAAKTASFFLNFLATAVGYKYSIAPKRLEMWEYQDLATTAQDFHILVVKMSKDNTNRSKTQTQTHSNLSFNIAAIFS